MPALGEFKDELDALRTDALRKLAEAKSKEEVEAIRIDFAGGKRGKFRQFRSKLRLFDQSASNHYNVVRREIEAAIKKAAKKEWPLVLNEDSPGARAALYKIQESRPQDSHPFDHASRLDECGREFRKEAKAQYKVGNFDVAYRLAVKAEACEYAVQLLRRK